MKLTKWLPDEGADYLRDFVPTTITYPSLGIFNPYQLQRLVAFAIQDHITTAIASVMVNVVATDEYPITVEPDPPTQYLFAAKDLAYIGNQFPLCFITFAGIRSMKQVNMQGSIGNKTAFDAVFDIMVTPVVREADPEIAEIKCSRLAAAIESIVVNTFAASGAVAKRPFNDPLNYYNVDVTQIKWIPGPVIAVSEKDATRVWSLNFPIHKRLKTSNAP